MTKTKPPAMLITAKEAGAILGMSQPTLRKWIQAGILQTVPSSPHSRRRKILRSELVRFAAMLEERGQL